MSRFLLTLLLSSTTAAAGVCPVDTEGTFPTTLGYYLPAQNICYGCRELNRFTQDFNNEAWNYIHNTFGAKAVYDKTFGNLKAGNSATTSFRVRNVSQLGQAANTTIITVFTLEHYTENSVAYCPTPSIRRTGIERWYLYTQLPSGETVERMAIPNQTPTFLPVPSTKVDDGYDPAKDCLYNDGSRR